ncbi:hypothetical protein IMSHALPRED_011129 [Imshaugia aleurites]|uniref:Uncharacterized protein n=1 Tax=Imshaugia aleurites TaxID=172621 RepID=A0A8H3G7T2_9LECA|nr:hypothetical protein IMSHALPRED_011129 [Imshaugia aleurites]
MDLSPYLTPLSAQIPQALKDLCDVGTFSSLLRALPTVLTSGLFMVFKFFNIIEACIKWALFALILAITYVLGLAILVVAVAVLVGLVVLAFMEVERRQLEQNVQRQREEEDVMGAERGRIRLPENWASRELMTSGPDC